jgi:hypothetical protein
VTRAGNSAGPIPLEAIDELPAGFKITYTPGTVNSPDKKKARIALVVVPSDHGKIMVLDPKPALETDDWTVPIRAEIVSIVYGPQGLDKGKIGDLVKKNDEVIGQLADYAQKTQETQALIQAITQQQQQLDSGQNVNAAVASFASQYTAAPRIDRAAPLNQQTLTLLQGVNPALSAYDPLAPNPSQRAAQSAGLAAAVAGLFFGTNVGIAATGGALLVNMHSLFFPGTEFRSAFAQDRQGQTALCGNKTPSASRTQLAFLWATRIPDAAAPGIEIPKLPHLPIGVKSSFPISVKARDFALAARIRNWKLISVADEKISVPVAAKVNAETKMIEIPLEDAKLKPGAWKLTGSWDWQPVTAGEIDLRAFSTFAKAHLSAESHDLVTETTGKTVLTLEGDDFEFLDKLAYKNGDDRFAQPVALPFHLPKGPREGPQDKLETQLEPKSLPVGNYRFLFTQADGKVHEAPFRVLPAPPHISNLPILVNTGGDAESLTLRGSGLDRIQSLHAEGAEIALIGPAQPDARGAEIKVVRGAKPGALLALQLTASDFQNPISIPGALRAAGPRPEIRSFRLSLPPDPGVALNPDELPANSQVSVELALENADAGSVNAVRLSCGGDSTVTTLKVHPEPHNPVFFSFDPGAIGPSGCTVMASVVTASAGASKRKQIGTVVSLPRVDSFRLTGEPAEGNAGEPAKGNAFYGEIRGHGLEAIERVGWDASTGTNVGTIPAPSAEKPGDQLLRVALPWPAPAPHAPLFIWLRGETVGRATTARW